MDTKDVALLRWAIIQHRLDAGEVATLEQALEEANVIYEWIWSMFDSEGGNDEQKPR